MKSKKRYVVAFWIAASMVVILAVAMVAVLAAFQAKSNSAFNISYTAINVKAKVEAQYKIATVGTGSYTTIQTENGGNALTFSGTETGESITQNFKEVNVGMQKGKDLIIHYTITNTASSTDSNNESFSITVTDNFKAKAEAGNLTVKYCTSESTTTSDWKANLSDLGLSTVADGKTVNIYVKVSITDPTQSVGPVTDANFQFLLAII